MRSVLALCFALAACATPSASQAQATRAAAPETAYRGPDLAAQRAAMARLGPLLGRWSGTADIAGPQAVVVHQTEVIETQLDGLLLVIRGAGFATPEHTGAPLFQAFAVISYDERRAVYDVRAYNNGHVSTAVGEFLADGAFRWTFSPGGPVQMRFTISFTQNEWRELGEISMDEGATWRQTIDMNLRRAA